MVPRSLPRRAHRSIAVQPLVAVLICISLQNACAVWETVVDGTSFNSVSAFQNKWSYNYPWGTDHNGSARMNQTNVAVSAGVVTLTSTLTNVDEGTSSKYPYLSIRYNSGTFYLKQQITVSPQYPIWDITGQFKVPIATGTWPAFWVTGVSSWPPESDIMEFKGSDVVDQETYNGTWQTAYTTVPTAASAWHTYRLVASLQNSSNVDFHYYIDGIMKAQQTANTFVSSACWLIVDYQMEGSSGTPGPNFASHCFVTNLVVSRENLSGVSSGSVSNGVYKVLVRSTADALDVVNQATAVNAPLEQWSYNGGLNQQWLVNCVGGNRYSLVGRQSGRALGVFGASSANGASVVIDDYAGRSEQQWQLNPVTNGYCEVINVNSGKALEVMTNGALEGVPIDQWSAASSSSPGCDRVARYGSNLVTNASGGVPGILYYVVGASNLAAPRPKWALVSPVVFDRNGNCLFTNGFTAGVARGFFGLELPSTSGASNQQWTFQPP